MIDDQPEQPHPPGRPNARDLGATAALRRAAIKAQRQAIATVGSFPIWQDGKVVYVTEVQVPDADEAEVPELGPRTGP